MLPPIKGFIKHSLIDWEGRIACILFLPGCNFRCSYCHSPHLVPEGSGLETIPWETVAEFLDSRERWIDGVVVSGGEPFLHDNLEDLLIDLKARGLAVKIDTNGSFPVRLKNAVEKKLVDFVACDVKAPFNKKYEDLTGASNVIDNVLDSVRYLLTEPVPYEFRTTVCSAVLSEDDVLEIAEFIRGAGRYVLQVMRSTICLDPVLEGMRSYTRTDLERLARKVAPLVGEVFVRGKEEHVEDPQRSLF
ncbi:MAG: anaerobic ribonucleoside-triphosphate reductase activating protein [Planctomycetota bacterium]|nr:MAG: anaerobic ribonucleoside-triphosphate reductase activating protein [Planctomycetota bacterium]